MGIYKTLFEINPSPSFVFKDSGKVTAINEQGKLFLEKWNDDIKCLNESNLKICLYQESLKIKNMEVHVDDKYYRFEVLPVGKDEHYFISSDVTHQKNTADTLFNLVDDVHEGLLLVDTDNEGTIVELNNSASKFLGYTREELLTLKLNDVVSNFELVKDEDWKKHKIEIEARGGSIVKNSQFLKKDGSTFPVEMIISIRHLMEKEYQLTLFRDITERLKAEKEKEQLKLNTFSSAKLSQLGEMATSIAHEINNPLTIITARAMTLKKMISQDKVDEKRAMDSIDLIESTVFRISKVIHSLRNISKSLEDKSFSTEPFLRVINDVLNLYIERLKSKSIKFDMIGLENLEGVDVYCNRSQLAQAFIGVLNNAVQAVELSKDRWMKLEITYENEKIIAKITDSGQGIPPDTVDEIFEPFFSTKDLGAGAGLGLAMAQSSVKRHKGSIYYDKKSKNSCFIIELPAFKSKS